MAWTKDGFRLASGHVVGSERVVGISPELDVHAGYDCVVSQRAYDEPWPDADRQELANEMCRLWKSWAAREEP